ncbi:hypothetical protein BC941DRAFT_427167 [Chlamydoabsidia padenii]|nr:hypothetical protein BC941DRAFT_427167 [Chlamydoabsidia padenii]
MILVSYLSFYHLALLGSIGTCGFLSRSPPGWPINQDYPNANQPIFQTATLLLLCLRLMQVTNSRLLRKVGWPVDPRKSSSSPKRQCGNLFND